MYISVGSFIAHRLRRTSFKKSWLFPFLILGISLRMIMLWCTSHINAWCIKNTYCKIPSNSFINFGRNRITSYRIWTAFWIKKFSIPQKPIIVPVFLLAYIPIYIYIYIYTNRPHVWVCCFAGPWLFNYFLIPEVLVILSAFVTSGQLSMFSYFAIVNYLALR